MAFSANAPRRNIDKPDAFFFFRVDDVKATNRLLDNLREYTSLDVRALASLEPDSLLGSAEGIPVYVLCIGESGPELKQLQRIAEAAHWTQRNFGYTPFLLRVYLPGAEGPSPRELTKRFGFLDENYVDFRRGVNDKETLIKLENTIRTVKMTMELRGDMDIGAAFRMHHPGSPLLESSPQPPKKGNRKEVLSLAVRTLGVFSAIGFSALLINAGLALVLFYFGVLASLGVSHRYGLRTGYFLISPTNTYLGILVSAGLVITAMVATVEQALKAF